MSKIKDTQNIEKLALDEAADWLFRIESDPSLGVSTEFEQWLMAAPDNATAYEKIQQTWDATALLGDAPDIQELTKPKAANENTQTSPTRRHMLLGSIGAAAACLAASALILSSSESIYTQNYTTKIGQIAYFTLPDSTQLTLDSGSTAQIYQSKKERRITLNEGRLFVDVMPDKKRPFIVETSDTTFTALGTSYSVFKELDSTTLEVYEGVVRFQQDVQTPLIANAGTGIKASPSTTPSLYEVKATTNAKPNWSDDRITFDNTSLSDAITAFSRYTTKEIEITDISLQNHKISGSFALTDISSFIRSVEIITNSQTIETDKKIIIN